MARIDDRLTPREKKNFKRFFDTGRIYMAKVMDTRNVSRSGEIMVHLIGGDGREDDPSTWMVATYASNFFGTTSHEITSDNTFENSPKSFGAWFPIPCIGNFVFVFFPMSGGESLNLYWFACPVNPNLNYMVPGIPGAYFNDEHKALTERNDLNAMKDMSSNKKLNQNISESEKKQALYDPLNMALERQGLEKDGIRGYSTAGAKRESPSMCYGILTPLGNSFVMDDGWLEDDNKTTWKYDNENPEKGDVQEKRKLVDKTGKTPFQRKYGEEEDRRNNAGFRFRTRNGSQITIQDDGTIYMINSEGTCWVEISEDGYLDAYSETGVNVSCMSGDINLHTTGDILLDAGQTIALKAKDIKMETTGNLDIISDHIRTNSIITANEVLSHSANISDLTSQNAQIRGTFAGTLQGTAFFATSASLTPVPQPEPVTPAPDYNDPEPQPRYDVEGVGYHDDENNMQYTFDTINTRVPTHEPYAGHLRTNVTEELSINVNNDYDGTYNSIGTSGGSYNRRAYSQNDGVSNVAGNVKTEVDKKDLPKDVPDVQLSPNFNLRQLCYSDTAVRMKISNVPNSSEIEKLRLVALNVLEPIKEKFGRVIINSGYRGRALNSAVKGALSSQHCKGEAVDIEVPGVSNYELARWIEANIDFDQLILEFANNLNNDPNSGWVHCSFNNARNRHETLTINRRGTKAGLLK